ncbi:hypothetical protein Tco_1540856 [Tanacetum coccineum]
MFHNRALLMDILFTEFKVGACPSNFSFSAEVRNAFAEYNIKEKRKLRSVVDEQTELLKVKNEEIENLKAQLLLKEAEAAEAILLRAEASKFEAIEKSLQDEVKILKDHNTTLEKERVHGAGDFLCWTHEKVTTYEDCMGKLEEFQDERMRVVDDKFASCAYLSVLGAAISKAIEKGMQDGLATGITHGQECRVLIDVVAFNPFMEVIQFPACKSFKM